MADDVTTASALPSEPEGDDVARAYKHGGGRQKRVAGEPTKPEAFKATAVERWRLGELARTWGVSKSEAVRRAIAEAADREGVPTAPPPATDGDE